MPKISLVVCLHKERDFLERLLQNAEGCYDDLVVVHDGREEGEGSWCHGLPDSALAIDWAEISPSVPLPEMFQRNQTPEMPGSLREYVRIKGGRFFEHPRVGSLEGQSPFAWWAAKHDWILRLDADEFPSRELKIWVEQFRTQNEMPDDISGFTCIWPLWDGRCARTSRWPNSRIFLFNRRRVQFFGIVEQVPIPVGRYIPLPLTLHHQPRRKSHGLGNILFRRQAYRWRSVIAASLSGSVRSLPRWNYSSDQWPAVWEKIRKQPLKEAFCHLVFISLWEAKALWRNEGIMNLSMVLGSGIHHFLFCLQVFFQKNRHFLR